MQSMAISRFPYSAFSAFAHSQRLDFFSKCVYNCHLKTPNPAVLLPSCSQKSASYNTLVFQAAMLLGPPVGFEASKLKVVWTENKTDPTFQIVPRTYTLSHCDLTGNLTLTISKIIYQDQLQGWYSKDDVVAEWTNIKGNLFLDVHCYVSGHNFLQKLAAEFRYHIFSKELPVVLEAVLHGDSELFRTKPELMDALVRVFFHSTSKKFNCVEIWGPLREATLGRGKDQFHGLFPANKTSNGSLNAWSSPKSIFQALVAFLL